MVELLRQSRSENRETFEDRLKFWKWEEKQRVMYAYDFAKYAHGKELRDGGIRYFEHARGSALILMDECGIKDFVLIQAILMHDVKENSSMFGNAEYQTHAELMQISNFRISQTFGNETAEIIMQISKPSGIDLEGKTVQEINKMYYQQLEAASADTLLVKMADRLHNLRDLYSCDFIKQRRKIEETDEVYLRLFEKVLEKYPKEGEYLLKEIRLEIAKWRLINPHTV